MLDLFHSNIWENIIPYFDIRAVSILRLCNKLIKENIDIVLRNPKTVFHIQRKDNIYMDIGQRENYNHVLRKDKQKFRSIQTSDYFVNFFLGRHGKFVRIDENLTVEGNYESNQMIGTWISEKKDFLQRIIEKTESYFNGNEVIEIYNFEDDYEIIDRYVNGNIIYHAVYYTHNLRTNIIRYYINDTLYIHRYIFTIRGYGK